jgi:hypothetical protein
VVATNRRLNLAPKSPFTPQREPLSPIGPHPAKQRYGKARFKRSWIGFSGVGQSTRRQFLPRARATCLAAGVDRGTTDDSIV